MYLLSYICVCPHLRQSVSQSVSHGVPLSKILQFYLFDKNSTKPNQLALDTEGRSTREGASSLVHQTAETENTLFCENLNLVYDLVHLCFSFCSVCLGLKFSGHYLQMSSQDKTRPPNIHLRADQENA